MDKKIYRVRKITWILPISYFLMIAFLAYACVFLTIQTLNTHATNDIVPLLSAIILTLFFAQLTLLFFDIPTIRIELSEEGMLFYGYGYRLYTPWHNISSVTWTKRSPRFPIFFRLKEPADTTLSLAEGKLNKQAILEKHWWIPSWVLNTRMIPVLIPVPVRLISKKEKMDGIMQEYLQYYAPHLQTIV